MLEKIDASKYLITDFNYIQSSDQFFSIRSMSRIFDTACFSFLSLEFVSPCINIYSNKSTNQMHQSLRFIACHLNTPQHVSGFLMSISGSSVVGSGRACRPEHDQQHCYHHVPTVNQRRLLQLIIS